MIFSMLASFHASTNPRGTTRFPTRPPFDAGTDGRRSCRVREVAPTLISDGRSTFRPLVVARVRTAPRRSALHAALTYISDLGSGFGQVEVPNPRAARALITACGSTPDPRRRLDAARALADEGGRFAGHLRVRYGSGRPARRASHPGDAAAPPDARPGDAAPHRRGSRRPGAASSVEHLVAQQHLLGEKRAEPASDSAASPVDAPRTAALSGHSSSSIHSSARIGAWNQMLWSMLGPPAGRSGTLT